MTTIGNLTQVIVGNVANDGTGDTLRQAFIITNDNMANLYGALGNPVGSEIVSNISGISFGVNVETRINSFNPAMYRAAKYIATISNDIPRYQISELLVIHDGSNSNVQIIGSSVVPLGNPPFVIFTSNIPITGPETGNVVLYGNTSISSNNVVKFQTIYTTT